jgi:hypothetical protein
MKALLFLSAVATVGFLMWAIHVHRTIEAHSWEEDALFGAVAALALLFLYLATRCRCRR